MNSKTEKMATNSIPVFIALSGAIATALLSIYHGIKAMIRGILAISGVFRGVKKAHKRIDNLEIKVNQLSESLNPMSQQLSAIYEHLIIKKEED